MRMTVMRNADQGAVTGRHYLPRMVKSPESSKPWLKGIMNQVNSWVALQRPQTIKCFVIKLIMTKAVTCCAHRASPHCLYGA